MGLLDRIWHFATGTSGRQEIPSKPTRAEAEKILTDEIVVQYRPGAHYTGMGGSAAAPNMSRFFIDVEEMVSHPAISHPLNSFKSGIANAVFEVEDASSPEHAEFALAEANRFWSRCLRDAQASYQYGRGGCEIVYSREDGALKLASLQAVMPLDARVLLKGKDYAGIRIKGSGPTYDLWGPRPGLPAKGWWKVHDRRYHRWYGFPQIYPAWRPWRRLAGRDGAEEVIDGAVYRFAYAPPIGRFPEEDNQPNARLNPGGVVFTNRGKMQEMLECLKAGGQVALSSRRDDKGEYVWDLKWPDKVLDVSGLIEYCSDLERACSLGCGWPPELTQASETGSGYSGRAIPLEVYYVGQQCQAEDMLDAYYEQIGEPLLQWNFGPGAWARLKVGNILESRMKAMGPKESPAPPGQVPPGQQPPEQLGRPPAGQMFSTEFEEEHPRNPDGEFAKKGSGEIRATTDKSKYIGAIVDGAVHAVAEGVKNYIADAIGGIPEEETEDAGQKDKKPYDVKVIGKNGDHDIEVKSMSVGGKQVISVHDDALLRKVEHAAAHPKNTFHTVVVDERETHGGGVNADNYSGHRVYYKRGSGRYALSKMYKVADENELKRLIVMSDEDLPDIARGTLPPPSPLEKLRATASAASESRKARDKARKARNKDKLREQARARAAKAKGA